jgi:predicted ATP-grasp superfamily ATP-dependent carboligase
MVESTSPRLVLPCDDTALRLLMLLALSPPAMMPPALHLRLAALIIDSLGDPAFYRTSIDKTMIGPAAAALGVRVPASIVVTALDDAKRFIDAHGFPIVIKRSHSTAGEGVAVCADQGTVDREFARLIATPALDLDDLATGQIVLQEFIAGNIHFYTAVAWRGALVSGVAVEKIEGELKGPTSAVRYFASPQMHAATARLAAGFGITGIFSPEFIVDPAGGEPYLLEINRRISHGTHRGARINVDAGAALYAAMHGTTAPRDQLAPGEEHFCAHFPHEWIRDPQSPLLRRLPVDVPWDEPELARALAAIAIRQLGKNPKEPHVRLP